MILGGGEVVAHAARELIRRGYRVTVVTSARHAREQVLNNPNDISLGELLSQKNIPFYVSDNVNTDGHVISLITSTTCGLSLAAAWIFRKEFIDRFNGKLVNLHRSNLPQYRGGGGYSWRILAGERQGGHTLHLVTPGIDAGDIIKQKIYTFPKEYKLPKEFYEYALTIDATFLGEFFDELAMGTEFELVSQDESKSTYWPRCIPIPRRMLIGSGTPCTSSGSLMRLTIRTQGQ